MVFVNNSEIKAVAATKTAGRSKALSLLILDEMAFIQQKKMKSIWASAQKALAEGGQGIFLSTPNGKSNLFYEIYNKAE